MERSYGNHQPTQEAWDRPFGDLSETSPVHAAASAMWRYETALRETEALGDKNIASGAVVRLEAEKDRLMEELSEDERKMAVMHVQLLLGPAEDPDAPPDGVEIYETDEDEPLESM